MSGAGSQRSDHRNRREGRHPTARLLFRAITKIASARRATTMVHSGWGSKFR
jgi:hypothetical protein